MQNADIDGTKEQAYDDHHHRISIYAYILNINTINSHQIKHKRNNDREQKSFQVDKSKSQTDNLKVVLEIL